MGILNATTVQKLQNFTELPEVYGKPPEKLQAYIDRAEAILGYFGTYNKALPGCVANLELAVNLLAENLVILRTPDYMRSKIGGMRSETIGSYSYTRDAGQVQSSIWTGLTDEIVALLGACNINSSGIRISRTNVFVPRTFSLPSYPDEKFYIPEDERIVEGTVILDPPDPRQR